MKVAALDLGSNTFLCLVADLTDQGLQIVSDQVEVVRLGQELSKRGTFHPEALLRAEECLARFSKTIQKERPDRILAVATAAARNAKDPESLQKICGVLNIPLEIISGQMEATLSFNGAISGLQGDGPFGVIDIGGGSTEVIVGNRQKIFWSQSLPFGAVKLTEEFFTQQPPPVHEKKSLEDHIQKQLRSIEPLVRASTAQAIQWVAVAGTPTELVSTLVGGFSREKVDGYVLTLNQLKDFDEKFSRLNVKERERMGIGSGRSDVILAGNQILLQFAELFSPQGLAVSIRGVRYGAALELAHR